MFTEVSVQEKAVGDYNTGTCNLSTKMYFSFKIFQVAYIIIKAANSPRPGETDIFLPVCHTHIQCNCSHITTQPVWITDLSVSQVTGSWSALWMVSPLTRGNFMPSVIRSVWHVTTSHRDLDLRPTRATQRSSVHLTIPDWTHWSMERWGCLTDSTPVCLTELNLKWNKSLSCLSQCIITSSLTWLHVSCSSPRSTHLWLMDDPVLMIWARTSWTSLQLVTLDWDFSESELWMLTWWHWVYATPETLTPLSPGGWDKQIVWTCVLTWLTWL